MKNNYFDHVTGVIYNRKNKTWYAYIDIDGKRYHLVAHPSKEISVQIRLLAEKARDNNTFNQFYEKLCKKRSNEIIGGGVYSKKKAI